MTPKPVKAWAVVDGNGDYLRIGKPNESKYNVLIQFIMKSMNESARTFNEAMQKWQEYEDQGRYRCIPVTITPEGE